MSVLISRVLRPAPDKSSMVENCLRWRLWSWQVQNKALFETPLAAKLASALIPGCDNTAVITTGHAELSTITVQVTVYVHHTYI